MIDEKEFLTIEEVCERLDRSKQHVYYLIKKKRLAPASKKLKGRSLWRSKDVDDLLILWKSWMDRK